MLDLVYIVKEDEHNEDLRYSLRSIAKYYPESKVWIVGYKPSWVMNVNYLPLIQNGEDKWQNSINNIIAACNCPNISDDFILMNDDFFMIKPIAPIEMVSNMNLGLLTNSIVKYKDKKTSWHEAFRQVKELLEKLGVDGPYYDYETHLPLEINKQKFLEVINLPLVKEFMKTSNVLHKRSLYKNFYKSTGLTLPADVKVEKYDDSIFRVDICGWLSVYDGQVNGTKYPFLNKLLRSSFANPCIYEREITEEEKASLKNIIIDPKDVVIPKEYYTMKPKMGYINF